MLAMLMLTLAPAISSVLLSDVNQGQASICSTSNAVGDVSLIARSTENFPRKSHWHFSHCHYCFTHAGSFLMPGMASIFVPGIQAGFHYPVTFYESSVPLFTWFSSQPRAPPRVFRLAPQNATF
ncbi:DUF2946 domain-containing protein [Undibacterium jejuense]|nr:DUF2946 domain-containing protein [Undibacterium jejuense]